MIGRSGKKVLPNKLQRTLRCHMTDAERALWHQLRCRQMSGCKFRRQHPFDDYVLDFVCLEIKLVIEVDGGQHGSDIEYDEERTLYLQNGGFRVLRFWNHEVLKDLESVMEKIWIACNPSPP